MNEAGGKSIMEFICGRHISSVADEILLWQMIFIHARRFEKINPDYSMNLYALLVSHLLN
jgi:hypothetical protein